MSKHFFSRRLRFFGSVAMLILCVVFFLVPFMGHGASKALQNMKNDVADWLPGNVTETKELKWFYNHFRGEAFVLLTWPNCKADEPSYKLLLEKLRAEIKPPADEDTSRLSPEEKEIRKARKLGDKLGLHVATDYREDWGGRGEKWLYGFGGSYFITPDGKLYRWDGQSGAIAVIGRAIRKWTTGKNRATGEFIEQFGLPSQPGQPNSFHRDPRKLTARLLKSVTTGPEILEQLAGENGTLVIGTDESSIQEARDLAYSRLSGVVFGPEPPPGFHWRLEEFRQVVSEQKIEELKKSNAEWETIFDSFVSQLVEKRFENNIQRLCDLPEKEQSKHWRTLFEQLGAEPPARAADRGDDAPGRQAGELPPPRRRAGPSAGRLAADGGRPRRCPRDGARAARP
ncbi:MAG: hypothetical protein IH991_14165, partial [Planctomycetes bacterium]|nr:hypothetical protein [Planctomycetota bacterium]